MPREPDAFVWIGLYEPTGGVRGGRAEFDLHELAVEDAIHAHQRPKLERLRRDALRRAQDGPVRRPERGGRDRRDPALRRRATSSSVRHGEAARWPTCASSSRPTRSCSRSGPSAVLYAVVDRVVDDYGPVVDGARQRHRRGRERGLLGRPRRTRPSGSTSSSARCSSSTAPSPLARAARPRCRRHAADRTSCRVLPRRAGPPPARGRAGRRPPRPAHERPRRQPRPGRRPPERGHAQDLRLGGDHRGPDDGRRHLRHELRAHARARVALRLPGSAAFDLVTCSVLYVRFRRSGWL